MKEKEKEEEKKYRRPKGKKNTFQLNNSKFELKKSFDQTKNPHAIRCFSTKLVINFVPQLKPKKSFCKPTFFQLNKDENNENEKSFELDKISSCDEIDDDEESNNSSSLMSESSSDIESDKDENENNNKKDNKIESNFTLDDNIKKEDDEQDLHNEDISYIKKKKKSSVDEYENLGYNKKKSKIMDETEEKDKNLIKNLRKEMSKIKTKTNVNKSKDTEEIINPNIKNDFDLGENNFNLDSNDNEKENNKDNKINKKPDLLIDKKYISNKNFSILDILSNKNKKN